MEAKLLLIPWLVSVFYGAIPLFWFSILPFAAQRRKMRRSPYLLPLPLWTLAFSRCVIFPLMIWMGERELQKRFGQSFHDYKEIGSLIPNRCVLVRAGSRHHETVPRRDRREV